MNEPEHYEEVRSLLASYRAAKFIVDHPYTPEQTAKFGIDLDRARKDQEQAERIIATVDKAIYNLRYVQGKGDVFVKVLYYRYINEYPLTTEEILTKLSYAGITKSRATYFRILDEATRAACYFIWGDDVNVKVLQELRVKN